MFPFIAILHCVLVAVLSICTRNKKNRYLYKSENVLRGHELNLYILRGTVDSFIENRRYVDLQEVPL